MSFKSVTNEKLIALYESKGVDAVLAVAQKMLELNVHKSNMDFRTSVHGEICESVLEVILLDFIKSNSLDKEGWFISKGLILKDVDNPDSPYLTEVDLILFTPYRFILFECKSYAGDKRLINECTIVRDKIKSSFDVYKQHIKHYEALAKTMHPFRASDIAVGHMTIALFNFALGKLQDEREDKWKNYVPVFNAKNINKFLLSLKSDKVEWNMKYVRRAVDIIESQSEANSVKHLNYVKSLHGNKK